MPAALPELEAKLLQPVAMQQPPVGQLEQVPPVAWALLVLPALLVLLELQLQLLPVLLMLPAPLVLMKPDVHLLLVQVAPEWVVPELMVLVLLVLPAQLVPVLQEPLEVQLLPLAMQQVQQVLDWLSSLQAARAYPTPWAAARPELQSSRQWGHGCHAR